MPDTVKDFHTGEQVTRFGVKVPSEPCASCGTPTINYDHLFGWHVCSLCDSDETAADLADHVMNPNRGYTGPFI